VGDRSCTVSALVEVCRQERRVGDDRAEVNSVVVASGTRGPHCRGASAVCKKHSSSYQVKAFLHSSAVLFWQQKRAAVPYWPIASLKAHCISASKLALTCLLGLTLCFLYLGDDASFMVAFIYTVDIYNQVF